MSAKPKRNWNDVQIAITTAAIVTSIGMWNLFATPAKTVSTQPTDPAVPPPTDPPIDTPTSSVPTALPYAKIMFTPGATQQTFIITASQQPQPQVPQPKKKHNKGGGGGGGSTAPVTKTKSS